MSRRTNKFRQHTKIRLRERYGLKCSKQDLKLMKRIITEKKSTPVRSISNNIRLHLINFNGSDILVMYHKKYKEIITVYPND